MYGRSAETTAVQWVPDLREVVLDHITDALAQGQSSVTIPLDETDAGRVLATWMDLDDVFYWSGRNSSEVMIGAGAVREASSHDRIDANAFAQNLARLEEDIEHGARYFGGFRFDTLSQDRALAWAPFGTYRFVLPRFLFQTAGGASSLTIRLDGPGHPAETLDRWRFYKSGDRSLDKSSDASRKAKAPSYARLADQPERESWLAAVRDVLSEIRNAEVEKVVLARAAEVVADSDPDVLDIFHRLIVDAPECYHVLYQPTPGLSFLSATPERLLKRDGVSVVTEAVAGTRPRSTSESDDRRLRDELFASDKERREHAVVGRSILDALSQHCECIQIDDQPSEMRLATGRHLKSRVEGRLQPGTLTADLVARLHPTPAVGGYPFDYARHSIRSKEIFDRGWYAGGLGWLGRGEAEFAVGIRSALVSGRTIRLYSGAGIVDGSVPEGEWQEIEQKLAGFLRILRLDGQ